MSKRSTVMLTCIIAVCERALMNEGVLTKTMLSMTS